MVSSQPRLLVHSQMGGLLEEIQPGSHGTGFALQKPVRDLPLKSGGGVLNKLADARTIC